MLRKIISHSAYRIAHIAKEFFLCLLSAVLLIFSFPTFDLWLFAWFGFVPLFFVLKKKSKWKAFLLSFFTGIVFWAGTIYWLIHVTLPGTIILILYLALYFGLFGILVSTYLLPILRQAQDTSPKDTERSRSATCYLLFIPSLWVLLEYIRSHLFTGFGWALLGYSQYLNLSVIQIADITGAWGVSFLVMMVNVAIYLVVSPSISLRTDGERSRTISCQLSVVSKIKICSAVILCLFITLIYGYYKLTLPTTYYLLPTKLRVSVIQANIPQHLKWMPSARAYILDEYTALTKEAGSESPDLIIWPEAASPGILGEEDWVFEDIFSLAKEVKIPLLIGAVVNEKEKYFNSALLLSSSGEIAGRYDKLHLVPFGEYIPLKKLLPFLETVVPIGDMAQGQEYTISEIQNFKFAVLICFEDLFPKLSRQFVKKGAQFLINITNDAWYKETSASFQHLQASVFRAVENRVFLCRAANTGVSGFIGPGGKIISQVEDESGKKIFISGFNTQNIGVSKRPLSFYTRYGDVFVAACFLFFLYGIIFAFKKKQ